MTQTINAANPGTDTLRRGEILAVNVLAGSGGVVQRLTDGGVAVDARTISASTTFGPYMHDLVFRTSAFTDSVLETAITRSLDEAQRVVGAVSKTSLLALADAGALTPKAMYLADDGALSAAINGRFLQSITPWFSWGPRTVVGSATSETSLLAGIYTPPVAPSGKIRIVHRGDMDDGTTTRRMYIRQVGYSASFPIFDRQFQTAGQKDWEIETVIQNMGSSAVQSIRSAGNSSQGMGTTDARQFAIDLNTSKEFAFSGLTAKTGSNVTITSLSKAGGVATGTVAPGTFGGLQLSRVAQVSGAGDTTFNGDPLAIALVGTDVAGATQFTYTLTGTGSAGGTPVLQLYRYFAIAGVEFWINQGLGAG